MFELSLFKKIKDIHLPHGPLHAETVIRNQALERAVTLQLSHIASNSSCPTQISEWKAELENLKMNRVELFFYKVMSYATKIFDAQNRKFEEVLEVQHLASRLVMNYSELANPSSVEFPYFIFGNSPHDKAFLKLSHFRLTLIKNLIADFSAALRENDAQKSSEQFNKMPQWIKCTFAEMIRSKQPIHDLKVLIATDAGVESLLGQFQHALDLQILYYTQLIYCDAQSDKKPMIEAILRNDKMVEFLSHSNALNDERSTFNASTERLLEKIQGNIANQPIRVTMVGAEYAGILKEGGLGEAIEGLSRGMLELNPQNQVSLIFPKYNLLPKSVQDAMGQPSLHRDSRNNLYKVYTQTINGVICYFIEDPLFVLEEEKASIYGEKEYCRFAQFSSLAADFIYEKKNTDVIHLHDWHVSGVALKLKKDHPREWHNREIPPVVFTFHNNNVSSQGRISIGPYSYDPVVSGYTKNGILDHNDNLFIKTLETADAITTVSKTFANEAQLVEKGSGVAFAVRAAAKAGKLTGIINGSNPSRWDPETDASLRNWPGKDLSYGPNHPNLLEQRQKCKTELEAWVKKFMPESKIDASKPFVTFIGRFSSDQKGLDKLEESIVATLKNGGQFICMGTLEDPDATELLDTLEEKYKDGVLFIRDYRDSNNRLFYQQGDAERPGIGSLVRASEFLFMPSRFEPCGLVQYEGWLYGSLAIGSNTGGLADTIIPQEEDPARFNGFLFDRDKKGDLTRKIGQALHFWRAQSHSRKKQIVQRLMQEGKKCDWTHPHFKAKFSPAQQYRIAYENARCRVSNRKNGTFYHLIDALRHKILHPQNWLSWFGFKSKPIHEHYLETFYTQKLDSQAQEKIYQRIPDGVGRAQFPHPYGKEVDYKQHEEFGARIKGNGIEFALLNPQAKQVSLLLLNDDLQVVQEVALPKGNDGKWKLFIPQIREGQKYQYKVDGHIKVDPWGRQHRFLDKTAVSVVDAGQHQWNDQEWMQKRVKNVAEAVPMSTYELHLGTWKKDAEGKHLNYRELAHEIVAHCQKVGYTHVELMGILEHPEEKSWGYQVSGYFSPNSRNGSTADFKYFVDYLHQNNIGVIIDYVPAHFSKNQFFMSDLLRASGFWHTIGIRERFFKFGSHHFDFVKRYIREFLISSAYYWLKDMHIDGLRVDCLPSIYYSENRAPAELFMRDLNAIIHSKCNGTFTVAEDYFGDIRTTFPFYRKGFGFDSKWNVSWMKKMVFYFSVSPANRKKHYDMVINSMDDIMHKQVNYISHDEVREEYGTIKKRFSRISEPTERNANIRAFLSLMFCLPGKKLNFAGNDFGNDRGFDAFIGENRGMQQDFDENNKEHQDQMALMQGLHHLYRSNPSLFERDDNGNDMVWMKDPEKRVHAYRRQGLDGASCSCFHNFTNEHVEKFVVEIPKKNGIHISARELFSSDAVAFGGNGNHNSHIEVTETETHISYSVKVPPFSTVVINEGTIPLEKKKIKKEPKPTTFIGKVQQRVKSLLQEYFPATFGLSCVYFLDIFPLA